MSVFGKGKVEQIIDLNGDQIILNLHSLQQILALDAIKDKRVCVISITGAFRQGKSFLLNFIIRYLHVKYKLKKTDLKNWLDPVDGPISGFPWKSGSQRHTVGILMWSEIFVANTPSGEEIAIILLDTQGSFDNLTSVTNCAAIFALSTLISSVQIYNLKENIKQYDLSHLECFSGYGQLAGNFDKSPFQNLLFLIRDWPWPEEKNYGVDGGRQFLSQIMDNQANQPPELVTQIKNIKELFQKINCFLLPHPGNTVARASNFQGNLSEIDPEFKKHIQDFVPTILAPENLTPKTANGQNIKVGDLLHFIESYCRHFQSGQMPSVQSMFTATSDAHHAIAMNESQIIYEKSMESIKNQYTPALEKCALDGKNVQSQNKAIQYFRDKKIMGTKETKIKFETILQTKLQEKFLEYENINQIKFEKEQEIRRQTQLRLKQQRRDDARHREQQRLYEDKLKQEEELRKKEQLRIKQLEEERQREKELRQQEQRRLAEERQREEILRQQEQRRLAEERQRVEERTKELERRHEREMEEMRRREEQRNLELERQFRREQFMSQPSFSPQYFCPSPQGFGNSDLMNHLSLMMFANHLSDRQSTSAAPQLRRPRGRPPGSKNKPK